MDSSFHQRVKELFLKARAVSPVAAQKTFVKKHANGDVALENEVSALLANDKEDTILSRDAVVANNALVSPREIDNLAQRAKPNVVSKVVFSSKGRAGLTFFVVAFAIALLGYLAATNTKKELAEIRGEETEAILNANVAALELWIDGYKKTTELIASNKALVSVVEDALLSAENGLQTNSDSLIKPLLAGVNAYSYIVTDLAGTVILAADFTLIGQRVGDRFGKEIYAAAGGNPQFILPFYQRERSSETDFYTEKPLVWMQIPVYNAAQKIIATFGIGRQADVDFTRILRTSRMGKSGETYAINKEAWFVSESRFEGELREKGILQKDTSVSSILNAQARKSGFNGGAHQLTELANAVLASSNDSSLAKTGVIKSPSEDYKGVQVIGAWAWLPKYDFGLITQVDAQEAFDPVKYMYRFIVVVVLLLVAASFFSFYNAMRVLKVQGELSSAVRMGQYELKKLLEEGGMGAVYLAEHRLLKRPTAVKIIRVDKKDEGLAKRFEREVHLASQLSHPNTVEIFDYGFTNQGQAFFAMEYIQGNNLAAEVQRVGALPPGRVIHIIKQVCASLFEAHTLGMVHRDIKPQNIMLCKRIGLHDFVKVLDFGLAKPLYQATNEEETRAITGTPVYISPERLKRPGLAEPSADTYAVGALMYFLLAGKPIFSFSSDLDILYQVLNDEPKPLPENVPGVLARLTFFCLEKDPESRPSSIEEVKMFLDNLALEFPWSANDAATYQT